MFALNIFLNNNQSINIYIFLYTFQRYSCSIFFNILTMYVQALVMEFYQPLLRKTQPSTIRQDSWKFLIVIEMLCSMPLLHLNEHMITRRSQIQDIRGWFNPSHLNWCKRTYVHKALWGRKILCRNRIPGYSISRDLYTIHLHWRSLIVSYLFCSKIPPLPYCTGKENLRRSINLFYGSLWKFLVPI